MRKIKLFEEYNQDLHNRIESSRTVVNSKIGRGLKRILSYIDDIIHFDWNLIPYSIKNKSTFKKLEELVNELGILKVIIKRSNEDLDFDDLKQYGVNPDVLLYIEDEDVKQYLQKDTKLFNRIYNHEYLQMFNDYAEWCENEQSVHFDEWDEDVSVDESIINEKFINKNNFYSCEGCEELFKSKEECNSCKGCGSDKIIHMDEIEWYKKSK